MLYQGEYELGSPRNITVNVLNANSFFTLDYETQPIHDNKNKTNGFPIERKVDKQKKRNSNTSHHNSFNIKNVVKSAQYTRKMAPIIANFRTTNIYGRIRKVDEMIEQKKKLINNSLQEDSLKRSLQVVKQKKLPELKPFTERKPDASSDQLRYHNYLFDTLPIKNRSAEKKEEKISNSFCDNYKNRRKLADRIANRKSNKNHSPLRRDLNPIQYMEQRMNDKTHWSPYKGKLLGNKNIQFLRQSVQGNKINYASPEPVEKVERYNKKKH